jgi:hypothetical protein
MTLDNGFVNLAAIVTAIILLIGVIPSILYFSAPDPRKP